jgi:hypothetical protein
MDLWLSAISKNREEPLQKSASTYDYRTEMSLNSYHLTSVLTFPFSLSLHPRGGWLDGGRLRH